MNSDQIQSRQDTPLLVVVSESTGLPAGVRSADRRIRRWQQDAAPGEDLFSGDPTDAACYEWTRTAASVTALIDIQPEVRARAALRALRTVRPDAAVLLLTAAAPASDGSGDGTLVRGGRLRDVLRLDLDEELVRLEAERRAFCLRQFADGTETIPILIHADPDPDAISSALAVRTLLGATVERMPIVTLEETSRPENRRMADLLHIRVTRVTEDELRGFGRVITVDTQPRGLQSGEQPLLAVIDHHPAVMGYSAVFADIRPEYGATASMMTEYLRAVGQRVHPALATALLYGIKTDTDALMRGVTPADVAAYAYLQTQADLQLVRRIERPSYALQAARAFGEALAGVACDDDLCAAYLGELPADDAHVLADLADFCLGIENVTWVAVAALIERELVITLRHAGSEPGADEVARQLAAHSGGSGGGHATMARVSFDAARARTLLRGDDMAPAVGRLIRSAVAAARCPEPRPAPAGRAR